MPADETGAVVTAARPELHCVTVRTAAGRKYKLGKPGTIRFNMRRRLMLWQRRHELKEQHDG